VLGNQKLPAVSASKDKNGLTHISLVNIDAKNTQEISIDLRGANFKSIVGRILTSDKLQNYNTFDNPEKIKPTDFKGVTLKENTLTLKLPPFSVLVLTLK
jgi:alpha-L-arabinofuranosidase